MCPGKANSGQVDNNAGNHKNSRAFCEGMVYRAQGTALAFPVTDDPHEATSESSDAWRRGWAVTEAAAGGVIDPDDAPNCAVPRTTIAA